MQLMECLYQAIFSIESGKGVKNIHLIVSSKLRCFDQIVQ